jgi:hypothetical protein
VFTYTPPNTSSARCGSTNTSGVACYAVKYTNYTVATNFGVSGINEFKSTAAVALVSEIDFPDYNSTTNPNSKYTFTYEVTPGTCTPYAGTTCTTARIASVTLPTGGTISYLYYNSGGNFTACTTGNNGVFSDGSASCLKRTTPDTGSNAWTYVRTQGSGAASTNAVADPAGNQTVVQFQGLYETQRDFYQGGVSPSNLLKTVKTCFNGNTNSCTTTAVTLPILQRNITTILSGGLQSEHDDFWNSYGAPTEVDDYDYGTTSHGALLKKTLATYTTMGNINAFRQNVTTKDGSGNPVSQVNYNYDETAVVATSGTPQHTNPTTARGNLTSINIYVSSTIYRAKSATYFDTGNAQTITDIGNGQTTYYYQDSTTTCGNAFPTSARQGVSAIGSYLTRSMTWNCTGGVQLTATDENAQITTTSYTDPYYWRPASTTDRTGAVTTACYGLLSSSTGTCTPNPNQLETAMNFNSNNSTVDKLITLDSLGRSHVSQTRQSPTSQNFDSVETDYDSLGRLSRVTLPYPAGAGVTNSTIASTNTTYDALSRQLAVSDSGGGSIVYSYGNAGAQKNDTLITQSPAPSNSENAKRRQYEYDALGRLSSACELTAGTTAWPGGNCAQNTPTTGYWTKYTYDPLGNLTGLTQNAQMAGATQSRSYSYDWMSRINSETVPEIGTSGGGTATYIWDGDDRCFLNPGDLNRRNDPAGNIVCYEYDTMHRIYLVVYLQYINGLYVNVAPTRHFVYDSATVNGHAMANANGRLAEAYTCFPPSSSPWSNSCTTVLTDLGLSYTPRGEVSDTYESTPNSGGVYYHVAQTYWANGIPYQLSGNTGLPATITYTPDGEGRINTVSASSGQNPVTGTTYNAASLPTAINFGSGSGDTDTFTYDPQTNRMTQYQFTVNGTSLTGGLSWNTNGTLSKLILTDQFNSANAQTCKYGDPSASPAVAG